MAITVTEGDIAPPADEPPILKKIRMLERSGDEAVSPKGAKGVYQITKSTADYFGIDYNRLSNRDYEIRSAKRVAAAYQDMFPGDEDAFMVAWNGGPGRAKQWIKAGRQDSAIKPETQDYLTRSREIGNVWATPGKFQITDAEGKPLDVPQQLPGVSDKARMQAERQRSGTPGVEARPAPRGFVREAAGQAAGVAHEALQDIRQSQAERAKNPVLNAAMDALNPLAFASRVGGDVFNYLTAPVAGAAQAGVSRAMKAAGISEPDQNQLRKYGEAATSLIPFGGGEAAGERAAVKAERTVASAAERAVEKARMAPPASHADKVSVLDAHGIDLTPGMRKGGRFRTEEEARKSSPYVGQAVEDAEVRTIESFNRAAANRTLEPLRMKYKGPVGTQMFNNFDQIYDTAFSQILPHITVRADPAFDADMQELFKQAEKLGPDYSSRLKAIVGDDVTRHFVDGAMDGRTFKDAESEISRQAREARSDKEPKERRFGKLLGDLRGNLLASAERHSAPGARQRLRDINKSYAMFTRMEEAAGRRKNATDMRFDTGDLLEAVRNQSERIGRRRREYIRGDALLQDLAGPAHDVIRAKLPDSGTARRAKQGLAGRMLAGAVGAAATQHLGPVMAGEAAALSAATLGAPVDRAIGAVTHRLATHNLEKAARQARTPKNYLARISHATSPLVDHRVIGRGVGVNALRPLLIPQQNQ